MKNAAVGLRVHSGWSALVGLGMEKDEPVVLCRKRVELVETFTREFRQPYHAAEKMAFDGGREFIDRVKSQAARLAYQTLRDTQKELEKTGHALRGCGLLLASGRNLPELEQILASHARIHTAEGELFREALAAGSQRCGLVVYRVKERELLSEAVRVLRRPAAKLIETVNGLGRALGAPWTQDEKYAVLAAWLTLQDTSGRRAGAHKSQAGLTALSSHMHAGCGPRRK
jgi:hypothetical protein